MLLSVHVDMHSDPCTYKLSSTPIITGTKLVLEPGNRSLCAAGSIRRSIA